MSVSFTRQSTIGVNAAANGIGLALNGGRLEFMTGVAPTAPDDVSAETVLAQIPFGSFSAAQNGVIEFEFIRVEVQAAGTVGWWRAVNSAGSAVLDGPVYATGDTPIIGGLSLASLTFGEGYLLTGTFRYQVPKTDS